jgi:endonuclease/exonuclease/phosphatase family metal-dependent hydrolase
LKNKSLLYVAVCLCWCGFLYAQVQPRGTEGTFDLVAWNVENFPRQEQATVDSIRMIILALSVDVVTMEEIADTTAFRNLVNSLEGWEGVYSSDEYSPGSYQKTGILYRTDQITLANVGVIFPNQTYPFPRPPLMAEVSFQHNAQYFDFHLIVVHLKAGESADDLNRRRQACQLLKGFIDQSVGEGEEPDFIVAGDFNDELDDPPSENSFTVFLDDTLNYRFLTLPLAGYPNWASYPSTGALIDHVLVTTDALGEYGDGVTETLLLDYQVSNYSYWISDHRPMFSMFQVPVSAVESPDQVNIPQTIQLLDAFPNPFNSSASIDYELEISSRVKLVVFNALGQEVKVLVDGEAEIGNHRLWWDGSNREGFPVPSGVYFIVLTSERGQSFKKIVVLR